MIAIELGQIGDKARIKAPASEFDAEWLRRGARPKERNRAEKCSWRVPTAALILQETPEQRAGVDDSRRTRSGERTEDLATRRRHGFTNSPIHQFRIVTL
jgi:hypothetical protein